MKYKIQNTNTAVEVNVKQRCFFLFFGLVYLLHYTVKFH